MERDAQAGPSGRFSTCPHHRTTAPLLALVPARRLRCTSGPLQNNCAIPSSRRWRRCSPWAGFTSDDDRTRSVPPHDKGRLGGRCAASSQPPGPTGQAVWYNWADEEDEDEGQQGLAQLLAPLQALRRGLVTLVLQLHGGLANQQALLLLQAATQLPNEVVLAQVAPALRNGDDVMAPVLEAWRMRPPPSGRGPAALLAGAAHALGRGWWELRLAGLVAATAVAFVVAGLVCVAMGVPPQATSLAGDVRAAVLGQYVQALEQQRL